VGAGPTGLALAIELARRGVAHRTIDRITERSDRSRALGVQARTLELMRAWGVSEPLVAGGQPTLNINLAVDKRAAARLTLTDIGVSDTPYPFILFTSQVETERQLDAALARYGGTWERGVELVDAHDEGDFVTATLQHADGKREELRCAYVVGCDGAHSRVRKAAGFDFGGAQYEQDFVLADVHIDWPAPPEELSFLFGKQLTVVVFPLPHGVSRIVAIRSDGAPVPEGEPTLEEVEPLLQAASPWPAKISQPRWITRFRLHHRGVDHYRRGRLFVAGDAAHIHSPAGGQGMNTGIQDAINLGWKLARVTAGRSPQRLLDSYDEERRPVGERLLRSTDRLFQLANVGNPILSWARNKLVPLAAPRLLSSPFRRRLLFRFVSELAIHYRGSSIVMPGCGERLSDRIYDGQHLLDTLASPQHHLLIAGDDGEFARAVTQRFAHELDVHVMPSLHGRTRGWLLVRPDGYIGAQAHALDHAELDVYFGDRMGASASKRSM
jgi:2-polyprenyl-6-methoxyphenol hydroxylase-like FAD-dependent oxidoreductase